MVTKSFSLPGQENLNILYEDNHIIAVYKPGGVLVQGDISGDISLMDMIRQYIKDRYKKPGNVFLGLIHRLDRPVSGVVVMAKTSKGASRLSEQFRSRSITKIYWAQVYGEMSPAEGSLLSFLKREDKGARLAEESDPGARNAVLFYRTLKEHKGKSLLEITLHTGRKHQIRAQLAAAGHPVVGDVKYGAPSPLPDNTIRLLAKSLTFKHPTRNDIITVECPGPDWEF
ncbi:MAG: RluA family pseudouridine synthase [bacterium]